MSLKSENSQPDNRKKMLATAVVIAACLLISGILTLWNTVRAKMAEDEELYVVVEIDGKNNAVFPLKKDRYYQVETKNGYNWINIEYGTVSVGEADCPKQICVHTKPISKPGETIVCLPHRVVVTIAEKSAIIY